MDRVELSLGASEREASERETSKRRSNTAHRGPSKSKGWGQWVRSGLLSLAVACGLASGAPLLGAGGVAEAQSTETIEIGPVGSNRDGGAIDFEIAVPVGRQRATGIRPIEEIDNFNIPLLMIHGDVDQRVPFEHYRKFKRQVDKTDKDVQFVVLKGADHFSNTLYYEHQYDLYSNLIGYLKEDCGQGGL